jgi:hypothetical protein
MRHELPAKSRYRLRDVEDGALLGTTEIDDFTVETRGLHQCYQPADGVGHVTEGTRLHSRPKDRQRLAGQGLHAKCRDHSAVVAPRAQSVRVEQPRDADIDAVRAPVGHGETLGKSLALVITGAGTKRVDIAAVGLRLWVLFRIAVDLGGRRHEESRAPAPGNIERIPSTDRVRHQRF